MEERICVVHGISDGMLDGLVKRLLRNNSINVYESSGEINDFPEEVKNEVSHVIVGCNDKNISSEYKELFDKRRDLILIELINNGKNLILYANNISEELFDKLINIYE